MLISKIYNSSPLTHLPLCYKIYTPCYVYVLVGRYRLRHFIHTNARIVSNSLHTAIDSTASTGANNTITVTRTHAEYYNNIIFYYNKYQHIYVHTHTQTNIYRVILFENLNIMLKKLFTHKKKKKILNAIPAIFITFLKF